MWPVIITIICLVIPFVIIFFLLLTYTSSYEIFKSVYIRMSPLNMFTGVAVWCFVGPLLIPDALQEARSIGIILTLISIGCYIHFWKALHHTCSHCGSRHTVKIDDSDGEYWSMDFKCKKCNKEFTVGASSARCSGD